MSSATYSSSAASRSRAEVCSARSPRCSRQRLVGCADLPQQRPVDDEVRIAADRAREVAVGRAGEARVPEVARVVAGLLQRAEDERRKRLAARGPIWRDVLVHAARRSRPPRFAASPGAEPLRDRRGRHVELGELGDEQRDRLRVGPLVHAVERLAPPAGEQPRDRLVRERSSAPRPARAPRARPASEAPATPPLPSNSNDELGPLDRGARRGRSGAAAGPPSRRRRARARPRPPRARRAAVPGRR